MQGGVKTSDKPPDLGAGSMYLRHPGLRRGNLYPKIFKYPFLPEPRAVASHFTGGWEQSESQVGAAGAVIPADG